MTEKTLVILKPCNIQSALSSDTLKRFESKGIRMIRIKMIHLTDDN